MLSDLHVDAESRGEIPNPVGFGISKGYWMACSARENIPPRANSELVLTILFVSKSLRDAETHALKVGSICSSITSTFGGYPFNPPRLQRIATVDASEKLVSQHDYYYDDQLHEIVGWPFSLLAQHRYQKYLAAFASTKENTRFRLQSAFHWYGIAVGAKDPVIGYVAAWTGLECIGMAIDGSLHRKGPKAPCSICGNQPNQKRDRTMAGIEHVFKSGVVEIPEKFSHNDAHQLRSEAVHGLREHYLLTSDCSRHLRLLIDLLATSLTELLTPDDCNGTQPIASLMAGDYAFQPCSRASIRFHRGQTTPYFSNWIDVKVCRVATKEAAGDRKDDLTMNIDVEWIFDNSQQRKDVESRLYEEFGRIGVDDYSLPDQSKPNIFSWQERPLEPVWQDVSSI